MTPALLDVNVLISLLDADHIDHDRARAWLEGEIVHGWASCPITENGFVRVVSQPAYPNPIATGAAAELLGHACATPHHEFWSCDFSLLGDRVIDWSRVHSHRQVTDAYLLALATGRGGRFVTFDRGVVRSAVPRSEDSNLVVL